MPPFRHLFFTWSGGQLPQLPSLSRSNEGASGRSGGGRTVGERCCRDSGCPCARLNSAADFRLMHSTMSLTAEHQRLLDARLKGVPWRKWGAYLSERQWGTVREDYSANGSAWDYFPHDHARS